MYNWAYLFSQICRCETKRKFLKMAALTMLTMTVWAGGCCCWASPDN